MKNRLFKMFSLIGPLFILAVSGGLLIFIVFNLYENLTVLQRSSVLAEIINGLYRDLLAPTAGTLLITFISVAMAAPVGIITGIYLHEYAGNVVRINGIRLFKYLSSLPSIVIGVFGLVLIISLNHLFDLNLRTGLAVSALALAVLVLPYIVHSTVNALSLIPQEVRLTALSLGARKYQNILYVLLPECVLPILGGIVLSIGRAAEDTAVIMLTGAAALAGIPHKLNDSFEALPFFIYYKSSEAQGETDLLLIFSAALLIIIISSLFIVIADWFTAKFHKRLKGLKR